VIKKNESAASTIASRYRGQTRLDVRRKVLVPLNCVGMMLTQKSTRELNEDWRNFGEKGFCTWQQPTRQASLKSLIIRKSCCEESWLVVDDEIEQHYGYKREKCGV
jgi:hypothetical protein